MATSCVQVSVRTCMCLVRCVATLSSWVQGIAGAMHNVKHEGVQGQVQAGMQVGISTFSGM